MSLLREAGSEPLEQPESGAAIRLGERSRAEREATRWGFLLVVFMRLLAGLWMFQGLEQWAAVLMPSQPLFNDVSTLTAAAIMFFAVLDLVAAVGLWLATPWGGVLWLFAAFTQVFVAIVVKRFFWSGWIAVNGVLIVVYFVLTWQAGRSYGQFGRSPRRPTARG